MSFRDKDKPKASGNIEPFRGGVLRGRKREKVMDCIILLVVVLIIGKLFYLQIIRGDDLSRQSAAQIAGQETELSPRGTIFDRNGEELAVSILSKSLYVNPEDLKDVPERWPDGKMPMRNVQRLAADLLAPVLELKADELYQDFITPDRRFIWVKRTLEPEVSDKVARILKDNKISGFHFKMESKRYYTKNKLAAQVLGFVGTDDKGLEGIEASQDKYIRSHESMRRSLFDARGELMGDSVLNPVKAPKMNEVYLTLDSSIQYVLEKSLDDAIAKTHAEGAAAIVMDPHTGEILGMASRPTFDPNHFGKFKPTSWMNRGVGMIYEPGSVFKPIVGCAGLMEGVITPDTKYYDPGEIQVTDRKIKNWDGTGLGWITYTDVIKFSVNTGMAELGRKLGEKRLVDYAKKFGFGANTNSDILGEESGILYDPDTMVPSDVASMSIGQGIAVTPLQMLRAICAIANGGELVRPYIVKKIVAPNGKILKEGTKSVTRNVITSEIASQMRSMMEKVVSEGGGKTAQIKGYRIAGKTGTAEKLAEGGGYAEGVYIASFVGFVPADEPRFAMLIMLDSPQGAFYGSQVAAPVFKETLEQILVARGIQPTESKGLPSMKVIENKVNARSDLPRLEKPDKEHCRMPDLRGLNIRQAAKVMSRGGLGVIPHGSGLIVRQEPPPGEIVKRGGNVEVWMKR